MSTPVYGMNFGVTDPLHSPSYTTTRTRLQSDLTNPAPLFDVKTLSAGSAISVNLAVSQTISEPLLVVSHRLGYIPQVYTLYNLLGTYSIGQIVLASGGSAIDFIGYTLGTQLFTIVHTVQSFGGGSGNYTSPAPNYKVWVKYIICNNPSIQTISIN